jgi:ADP-heptose:LPS heptosyltransferase
LRLQQESFDILFSLEITTPGTLIANIIKADQKFGYFFDNGATRCFNVSANEYLETAFLTHLKKQNRKTYQELMFLACELPYEKEEIIFELDEKAKQYAEKFKQENNISDTDKIIGINLGSGGRWPSKAWSKENIKELVRKIQNKYKILFLGGPEEKESMKILAQELEREGMQFLSNNPENTVGEFAAILNLCEKIITTDSFALHLSIALKKPTLALFFSTPDWEIESYDTVKKIASPLLDKYFFTTRYSEELANSISVQDVVSALEE